MVGDDMDLASDREEIARQAAIKSAAKDLEPGSPGDCSICGEFTQRLVRNACAACRMQYLGER